MKIAFDAKRAFANRRGLGNYSRDVIRLMRTYAPQHTYTLCGVPSSLCDTGDAKLCVPQGVWRYVPALWRAGGCLSQLRGVDIYHGLSGELPYGIHRTPMKSVVTMHDAIFMRYPRLYSPTYRWLFEQKVRYALRAADVIMAISEQTKQDLVDYFAADATKIQVVYQGCSQVYRQPISEEQVAQVRMQYHLPAHYLLYVGALEERKNLHRLIAALDEAKITIPLVLVGAPSTYGEKLCKQAEQLHVHVQCLSAVPQQDLPAIYKGAKVFVYPSIFEGFGIPILEAMCVGTPVVTSTGSCFAEVGGSAAKYANPMDYGEIARVLQSVIGDSNLRAHMQREGYKQVELFTDERVAANLIKVYSGLCD